MAKFEINAQPRKTTGKAANRRMRRLDDQVPGIVYGGGKEPQAILVDHKKMNHALENEAFYSNILTLSIDGNKEKVVLKALQRHPSKPKLLHVDFFRISAKEKLTMLVPLHFLDEEEAPGVKEGGVLSHTLKEVEVRCLPADLPEFIDIDISQLPMDGVIHLSDITMPEKVEIVALSHEEPQDQPVVSIHPPRVEVEPEPEEVEGEEGAEGEAEAEGEEAAKEGEGKPAADSDKHEK